ncbi:NAD(P)-binding protein, partial [Epithele typhae]|uniref:NAD(P)-binding protein n=1 Tax=Epithele typhae TaxID=378194 RepID=UPI00200815C2
MPSLSAIRAANLAFSHSYVPVAVFVGGTSGIGAATAQAFARATHGNAHIVIVGRDRAAGDAVIASFPKPTTPDARHEFVQCADVSLMRNVRGTAAELRGQLDRINFLVLTAGYLSMAGRVETAEGLDKRLGTHYYARWLLVRELVPLLEKAKERGEHAKVMSVLGGANMVAFDVDNLGLKKNYMSSNPGIVGPTYTDLAFLSFAERHPGLTFVQGNPGGVRTNILKRMHWSTRILNPLLNVLLYPLTSSAEECGQSMLYGMLQSGPGAQRRGTRGDDMGPTPLHADEEAKRRLWEHTEEEVERAL